MLTRASNASNTTRIAESSRRGAQQRFTEGALHHGSSDVGAAVGSGEGLLFSVCFFKNVFSWSLGPNAAARALSRLFLCARAFCLAGILLRTAPSNPYRRKREENLEKKSAQDARPPRVLRRESSAGARAEGRRKRRRRRRDSGRRDGRRDGRRAAQTAVPAVQPTAKSWTVFHCLMFNVSHFSIPTFSFDFDHKQ